MSHLLIIELPGGNDTDILVAANQAGHRVSLLTAEPAHYLGQPEVAAYLAPPHAVIDAGDFGIDALLMLLAEMHQADPFDAILCLQDLRIAETARIARSLGLKHLNPKTAALCRDKAAVRKHLAEAGITQPPFVQVRGASELIAAVDMIGLPLVVKPTDGFGSQSVFALLTPADIAAFRTAPGIIADSLGDYGLGVPAGGAMLVERLMQGQLVGCDTMSANGRHVLLGVNEKLMFPAPSFAIRGGCFTANCGQFGELEAYVVSILDAIRFDHGAAHIELMLTKDGPRLIEINPRLVGARIGRLISAALDRSIHEDLIELHLTGSLPSVANFEAYAVSRWLAASAPGILYDLALPSLTEPGIVGALLLVRAGDVVTSPYDNADRLGCVITRGACRVAAEILAEGVVAGTVMTVLPVALTS